MDEYNEEQFEHSECVDENNELMDLNQEQQGKGEGELEQCEICQKKFLTERIEKLRQVCEKVKQKYMEREKLIKGKQQQQVELQQKLDNKEKQVKKQTVNNWREQHKQFQVMIHQKKNKEENSQYVYCEYCKRSFDKYIAQRHIPKCKEIQAKPKPSKTNQLSDMKRMTQLSTASTTIYNENIDKIKQFVSAQSLMKTADIHKTKLPELKKAINTGFGFMDCQTRAIALSDTECPYCLSKFNQKLQSVIFQFVKN